MKTTHMVTTISPNYDPNTPKTERSQTGTFFINDLAAVKHPVPHHIKDVELYAVRCNSGSINLYSVGT